MTDKSDPIDRSGLQLSIAMPAQPRRRRRSKITAEDHNAIVFLRHEVRPVKHAGRGLFKVGEAVLDLDGLKDLARRHGWTPGWKFRPKARKTRRIGTGRPVQTEMFGDNASNSQGQAGESHGSRKET